MFAQANTQPTNVRRLIISAIYAGFLTVSEMLYRIVFEFPRVERLLETWAIFFLFLICFVFAKWKLGRWFIGGFFALSMIANNIHFAIYRSWITGINYYLMFAEIREVSTAATGMVGLLVPHLLWAIIEIAFFISILFLTKPQTAKRPIADCVFILLILFIIIKSFGTVHKQGITPYTGASRLKANYYSFGYFVGRILPYQWFNLSKVPLYTSPAPKIIAKPKIRNIILIMGESEAASHLQVFGYSRETSPFLNQLAKNSQAIVRPIYSAGKMTFVSLPLFFNAIPRPNGLMQMNQGTSNLFRLAQQQGFKTLLHTSQPESEMELINLIGSKYLDKITYPTELGYDVKVGMNDNQLLPYLHKTDLNQGQKLLVLHQRGSHMPYAHYLSPNEKFFKDGSNLDNYDSTIRHTDLFIQQVLEYLNQQPSKDWVLIYTSDHGQYVTNKVANQGTNDEDAYLVPLVIYSPNAEIQEQAKAVFLSCQHAFQQQLAEFLQNILGYDTPLKTGCQSGVITNNSITGDIGWIEVDSKGKKTEILPK